VRAIERGELNDPFAARLVWTLREGEPEPVQEWLVMRRETKKRCTYSLSNAPADSSLEDWRGSSANATSSSAPFRTPNRKSAGMSCRPESIVTMFLEFGHKCMRWLLGVMGRLPE